MAGVAKLMKNRLYVFTYLYSVVDVFFLLANSVRCRRSIVPVQSARFFQSAALGEHARICEWRVKIVRTVCSKSRLFSSYRRHDGTIHIISRIERLSIVGVAKLMNNGV